jgi:hypothetical protein
MKFFLGGDFHHGNLIKVGVGCWFTQSIGIWGLGVLGCRINIIQIWFFPSLLDFFQGLFFIHYYT